MSNRAQSRSYSKMEATPDLLKAVAIFGLPGRAEGSALIKVFWQLDTREPGRIGRLSNWPMQEGAWD